MRIDETISSFFKKISSKLPKKKKICGNDSEKRHYEHSHSVAFVTSKKAQSEHFIASPHRQDQNIQQPNGTCTVDIATMQEELKIKSYKMKVRVVAEKAFINNFAEIAGNSSNSLGAFLYGTNKVVKCKHKNPFKRPHQKQMTKVYRKTEVKSAFVPNQTSGKYMVNVQTKKLDAIVTAPCDHETSSVATLVATSEEAEVDKENITQLKTTLSSPYLTQNVHALARDQSLIGWMQAIHVDKRIIRRKSAVLKEVFAHIEKTLGHLFISPEIRTVKHNMLILISFIKKNSNIIESTAYERSRPGVFRKVTLKLVNEKSMNAAVTEKILSHKPPRRQSLTSVTAVQSLGCSISHQDLSHVSSSSRDESHDLSTISDMCDSVLQEISMTDLHVDLSDLDLRDDLLTHNVDSFSGDSIVLSSNSSMLNNGSIKKKPRQDTAANPAAADVENGAASHKKYHQRHPHDTEAARSWFRHICGVGKVPKTVQQAAQKLFECTFPLPKTGNPSATLMSGHEYIAQESTKPCVKNSSSTSSYIDKPLLSCNQHQMACLRLAYKFSDDLFPRLNCFSDVADDLPMNTNKKNWWRLAETAIMTAIDWQMQDFFL